MIVDQMAGAADTPSVSLMTPDHRPLEAMLDDAGNLVIPTAGLPLERAGLRLVMRSADVHAERPRRLSARSELLVVALAAALVVGTIAVLAAHGRQWSWTGFATTTGLWNWLQMVAQPIALACFAVWLRSANRELRVWRITAGAGALMLAILILGGYGWHWSWTGFSGKHLWDWLKLMLFPLVIVLLPEWVGRGEPFGTRAQAISALALVAFGVLVVGGYRWGWTWTGFTGNSFRDWLELMIAPFLLPISIKIVHARRIRRQTEQARELVVPLSLE